MSSSSTFSSFAFARPTASAAKLTVAWDTPEILCLLSLEDSVLAHVHKRVVHRGRSSAMRARARVSSSSSCSPRGPLPVRATATTARISSPPLSLVNGPVPESVSLRSFEGEQESDADERDEEEDDRQRASLHRAPPEGTVSVVRRVGEILEEGQRAVRPAWRGRVQKR